jgi:hypothetical protein
MSENKLLMKFGKQLPVIQIGKKQGKGILKEGREG